LWQKEGLTISWKFERPFSHWIIAPRLTPQLIMASPTIKLRELGLTLPELPQPAGNYVHAVRCGTLLFLAGKGVGPYYGKVGRDVTTEQAYEYARCTCIMLLAVISQELGSVDRVKRVVKVTGFVNAMPDFREHPRVMDGCSDLLLDIFGAAGRHARTAIGVGSTPSQIPLEIEIIVEFVSDCS
jgi:enamine deaminase RidA (YjgF/YER057c/UK114 family)